MEIGLRLKEPCRLQQVVVVSETGLAPSATELFVAGPARSGRESGGKESGGVQLVKAVASIVFDYAIGPIHVRHPTTHRTAHTRTTTHTDTTTQRRFNTHLVFDYAIGPIHVCHPNEGNEEGRKAF